MTKTIITYIIEQLKAHQNGKVWVGATYARTLADIDDNNAFIRPAPGLHSVAEIISHLTTWQKETLRKTVTGAGSLTDDCEENWYTNEKLRDKGWPLLLLEYQSSLNELITVLETKNDLFLEEKYYDPDFKGHFPYSFVINGMLHHNLYHLGQLGVIVKHLKLME